MPREKFKTLTEQMFYILLCLQPCSSIRGASIRSVDASRRGLTWCVRHGARQTGN